MAVNPSAGRADRLVYRRIQPSWLVLVVVWVTAWLLMYLFGPADWRLSMSLVMAAGAMVLHLAGPAASIVVTPQTVLVSNVFTHWRVARSQLGEVAELGWSDATLAVRGRETPIDLTAFGSIGRGERGRRPQRWKWLLDALDRVPRMPDDGRCHARPNWLNIVLAAATLVTFVAGCLV